MRKTFAKAGFRVPFGSPVKKKVKVKIVFQSESKYVVHAANRYVYKWEQNNQTLMTEKTEAKHIDLWEKYLQLEEMFQLEVINVKRDSEDGNKAYRL